MSLSAEVLAELGEDLGALTAGVGRPLLAVEPLSWRGADERATAFRLRFAGGLTLKGSRLKDAGQVTRVVTLAAALAQAVPRVIDHAGAALLCEWVDGETLASAPPDAALLRACGAVQAGAHAPAPAALADETKDIVPRRLRRLQSGLDALRAAGRLAAHAAEDLATQARRLAPPHCEVGIILGDFCAENLVRRGDGTPCLIDLETLAVDAFAYDLARTWYRWPLGDAERAAYLAGYASRRSPDEYLARPRFWDILAVVDGAVFRHDQRPATVGVPLAALRALLREPDPGGAERG